MVNEPTNDGHCAIDAYDGLTTFSLWAALMDPAHLWGPCPPPDPGGVHVHCEGFSAVDDSFDLVVVRGPSGNVEVTAPMARLYWLADMLRRRLRAVNCPKCETPYVDAIEAIRRPPTTRTCAECGCRLTTPRSVVANPLADAWERAGLSEVSPAVAATGALTLKAQDFSAIALWPTSTEILTNEQQRQPSGIHVHAWDRLGAMVIDGTYCTVRVDEAVIGTDSVRREAARVACASGVGLTGNVISEEVRRDTRWL